MHRFNQRPHWKIAFGVFTTLLELKISLKPLWKTSLFLAYTPIQRFTNHLKLTLYWSLYVISRCMADPTGIMHCTTRKLCAVLSEELTDICLVVVS